MLGLVVCTLIINRVAELIRAVEDVDVVVEEI